MLKNVFLLLGFIMIVSCLSMHNRVDAQTSTGSISGTVTDESGSPISGVTVSLKSKKPKFKDSGTTGSSGEFEFSDLSAGKYILTVVKSGYSGAKKNIKLKAGQNKVVSVQLKTKGGGGGSGSGSGSGGGGGSGSGSGSGSK